MLELETAAARILTTVPAAQREEIPLAEADGRVLAEDLAAALDLPPFDNSAMDGYAVRAGDVLGASPEAPVGLRLNGRVAAGETFAGELSPGGCVRLFTGSPIPPHADAVVRQEDTRPAPGDAQTVLVLAAPSPGENVRRRGEDVRSGGALLRGGVGLRAPQLGLLSACGIAQVRVGARPRVGLLASGSELCEPGRPLAPGQVYEGNLLALAALVRAAGGVVQVFPRVADTLSATSVALASAFAACDVVVTCGGVSVGDLDFIKPAFEAIGGTVAFWQVAMKPGRPFVFGRWRERFLFGLPGNPVSALVTFLLLVRPALLRWQGAVAVGLPAHPAVLDEAFHNPGERRHFVRVRVDADGRVRSAGLQASHCLSSLAAANALLDLPPHADLPVETTVRVLRWEM